MHDDGSGAKNKIPQVCNANIKKRPEGVTQKSSGENVWAL
jgi:hypothetical protein